LPLHDQDVLDVITQLPSDQQTVDLGTVRHHLSASLLSFPRRLAGARQSLRSAGKPLQC
jgi:hypothetical protein